MKEWNVNRKWEALADASPADTWVQGSGWRDWRGGHSTAPAQSGLGRIVCADEYFILDDFFVPELEGFSQWFEKLIAVIMAWRIVVHLGSGLAGSIGLRRFVR